MDNRINERSDLQEIIDKALKDMAEDAGGELDLACFNLAEFQRRTGLSRSKARTLKSKGFRATPHGRTGQKAAVTVMTGYEETVDALLAKGVTKLGGLPGPHPPGGLLRRRERREGLHQGAQAPRPREAQGRLPAGQPRPALPDRARRGLPDQPIRRFL